MYLRNVERENEVLHLCTLRTLLYDPKSKVINGKKMHTSILEIIVEISLIKSELQDECRAE